VQNDLLYSLRLSLNTGSLFYILMLKVVIMNIIQSNLFRILICVIMTLFSWIAKRARLFNRAMADRMLSCETSDQ
jgi:hypothetical protein